MALTDAGLAASRFRIDAVDISRRLLALCERGVYGKGSFRGDNLAFRDRYFTREPDGLRIASRVRRSVRFAHGNLLDGVGAFDGPYDVVFCRNLLIYLNETAKPRAIGVLRGLLTPDGVLFTGHAEIGLVLGPGFAPAPHARSFAYRRVDQPARPTPAARPPARVARQPERRPRARPARRRKPPAPAVDAPATLIEARRLADMGRVGEALVLCERLVADRAACADCYCLMGILCEVQGRLDAAEQHFGQALYAAPDHYEAMVHLHLLLERRGQTDRAAVLRRRADRVAGR